MKKRKENSIMLTMTTTILFQNLKIIVMSLLLPATSAKLITCSKYLKKEVAKDRFI